ncbi:hypothetical protein KP509_22G051000 [Ceratopteris richardii]|nr:hypothetical protein KP509_22G051000 [Ceratopteris richardii]
MIPMDTDRRMAMRCIMAPDQAEHMALKEYARIRLMQVIAERDAAFIERDNVLAEKKAAINERDSAFLQRDIAFAERDAAIMERDNAMAALENARGHRNLGWNQFKKQPDIKGKDSTLLQMSLPSGPFMVEEPHSFNADPSMLSFINSNSEKIQPMQQSQQSNGKSRKRSSSKAKRDVKNSEGTDVPKSEGKKKRSDNNSNGQEGNVPLILPVVPYIGQESDQAPQKIEMHNFVQDQKEICFTVTTPIPYCSCTGMNQPCYRWGNGGWQSACCTNILSVHPLPMNPSKRGYRLPGRKMSAGAFQKLVKRLTEEGADLSQPIDLKNYWAKHGTNRYTTIK